MARKSISSDANSSGYNYLAKQMVEAGSNKAVILRNGEHEKLKYKLCYAGGSTNAEMLSSWPPRLYTCSFCKRRFESAQALGGHMNVHRRARAMLRSQSSFSNSITSPDNLFQQNEHHFNYPNSNPNRNWRLYTSQYATTTNPSLSNLSHLPVFNLTPSHSLVSITHKNSILPTACNCEHMLQAQYHHHAELTTREKFKKNCIVADNQFNGLCSIRTKVHQDDMVSSRPAADQEDIDLELRLGF